MVLTTKPPLDAIEMKRRFPQFVLAESEVAFYEKKAGYLRPEECIKAAFRMRIEERSRPSIRGVKYFHDRCRIGRWRKSRHEKSYLPGSIASYCSGSLDERACPKVFPVSLTVSRRVMFWLNPTNQHASFGQGGFPDLSYGSRPKAHCFTGFHERTKPASQKLPSTPWAKIARHPLLTGTSIHRMKRQSGPQLSSGSPRSTARFLEPPRACTQ